jgi:Protein of unknown function (DUF3606)
MRAHPVAHPGGTNRRQLSSHPGKIREKAVADSRRRGAADRSKISMSGDHEVRYWAKHLGVTPEELRKAVDKVGNSAASVRKELGK